MSNDARAAQVAQLELEALRDAMADRGLDDWVTLADAQIGTIKAWAIFNEINRESGLALMQVAAETEDSISKPPVTPGHVLPARELLGEMLSIMDHKAEAKAAYQAALAMSPGRRRSINGLAD